MTAFRRLTSRLGWWDALATPGPPRVLAVNALVDSAGTGLAAICLPFFALEALHLSAGEFAMAISAAGAAELLMTVPAGVIAGRVGVRNYSIASRVARAAIFLLMAFSSSLWAFLALSVAFGLLRAATGGLTQSYIAAVLGADKRSGALAVTRALRNIGYLVSGGIGAVLLVGGGEYALRAALVVNGLSFLVSAGCMALLRPTQTPARAEPMDWSVLKDLQYLCLAALSAVFTSSILVLDIALPLWVLRHDIPKPVVAIVIALNTAMVVLMQYRFSRQAETVKQSLVMIRWSAVAFAITAALIAVSAGMGPYAAAGILVVAGVTMTLAEMAESPAWWTLAYEMARPGRADEYLAAFDLKEGLLNIAGPLLMVAVVEGGSIGWIAYAACVVVSGALAQVLVRKRQGTFTPSPTAS